MPSRCIVPQCRGNYENGPKVTVFSFPKKKEIICQWINAIKRKDFTPSKYSRVCELHFRPEDIQREASAFDEKTGKTISVKLKNPYLKDGAIPRILPNFPSYLSSSTTFRESPNAKKMCLEDSALKHALCESVADELEHDQGSHAMKMQTGSEEQDIPTPAPGVNVYPIYSNGAICGYIYSGGDQKTHKIILNGENQPNSSEEEKLTRKRKNVFFMKNTFVNKVCKKNEAENKLTNPNPCKDKTLSTAKPSSEKHIKSEPLTDSALENNVPLPISDTLLANKDTLLIEKPTNARNSFLEKQCSNLEKPVITPTSASLLPSNVTNSADKMLISSKTITSSNNKVIFSPSLNSNCNIPIVLTPNKSLLQPTNCLATPGQLANWVTSTGQPANWVTSTGQPTNWVTSTGQPTNWMTSTGQPTNWVNSTGQPANLLTAVGQPTNLLTAAGQPTNLLTAAGQPTNLLTAAGQPTNLLTVPGQSTLPANTVTYVLMSAGQAPVYLGNSTNALTRILPKNMAVPARINISSTITTTTTTSTGTVPVSIRPAEKRIVPNLTSGQLSSMKDIKAKSTFVQLPIQVSTLVSNNINISDQSQNIAQSTLPQKILKQTNLENKEKLSQIPLSINKGVLKKFKQPNHLKPEMTKNNHISPVVQASDINLVKTVEKPSDDSSSLLGELLNNPVTTELSKTRQNKTEDGSNLMTESCEKTKSTTSEDNKAVSSKENNVYDPSSILESIKIFLAKPTANNKPSKDCPRKLLVPSKYKCSKQTPVFSATENTGSQLFSFNLPSGNYMIHSKELKTDIFPSEKLSTCEEKDSENETGFLKRRPSLEGKTINNEEKITIKTEPLDDKSGDNQSCSSLAVSCTSSATSFPADIETKRKNINEGEIIIKTELLDNESGGSQDHNFSDQHLSSTASFPADNEMKIKYNSETESTTPTNEEKGEDNELVISSCFSLSINSEDERKLPFDATNSNLNSLFFLPQQSNFDDSNEILSENSESVAKKSKLSEFSVDFEDSDLSSYSLTLSTAKEKQIPCAKNMDETSSKLIIDPEYMKQLNKNSSSDDKFENSASPFELNGALLKSKSIGLSEEKQIPTTKKWYEAVPYKSIVDPEYVKTLKENDLSDDKTKNSVSLFELNDASLKSKLVESSEEKQVPCGEKSSKVSQYKSIIDPDYIKKFKEEDISDDGMKIPSDTFRMNKASLLSEEKQNPCVKKWYEISPYKSIINPDDVKTLKSTDDETKIPVDPSELNKTSAKRELITISEDILTTPSSIDKTLTSEKNVASHLLSMDDFLIDNLTKDKEADSFLEGRIAFHQQQLNLLQLQVEQHKTMLEKLKKAQNYLRGLT